jgi:hypothetical protein
LNDYKNSERVNLADITILQNSMAVTALVEHATANNCSSFKAP